MGCLMTETLLGYPVVWADDDSNEPVPVLGDGMILLGDWSSYIVPLRLSREVWDEHADWLFNAFLELEKCDET